MADQYKILHSAKYYRDFLACEIRPDGRKLDKCRPMSLNLGSVETANGSAIAKLGNTTVVCGIKAELCIPNAECPKEGFLIPNVELPPSCSPKFRPGPPSDLAQISTQLIADIIRNSQCLDLRTLCIFPDKLAWCIYADLVCLDLDGSVIDACIFALMAALKSVKLPLVEYDPVLDTKQINLKKTKSLQISNIPISTTFALFSEKILVDPTIEEEDLCTALVTIVTKDNDLCLVHKQGGSSLTNDQLMACLEEVKRKTILTKEMIMSAVNS